LYFVTTTLTTVGYGDIKGQTVYEYIFVMLVEFTGIMFFSFIMGSINNILAQDFTEPYDIFTLKEKCDIWLNNLDKIVKRKSMPNGLYNAMRFYIIN
jgi:hypothetical protein